MIAGTLPLVRRCWLLLFVLLAAPGLADDWRETLTRKKGDFPPLRPLTARYDFGWSGVKAAEATAEFSKLKGGKVELDITGRTVGASRLLWRMDTKATSTVNGTTLRPLKLTQKETYAKKSMTTSVDFTAEGPATLRQPDPPDANAKPAKVKRWKFAEAHDLHSALLFIRSQPLRQGQTTRVCVFPGSSPYLAEATVAGREKVKVAGKEWPAIRCELKLRSIAKDFTLAPHSKFKEATVWVSDDADRLLLKIEAEVFVGKIWVELKDVKFAGK